jgi:hypothetical protein
MKNILFTLITAVVLVNLRLVAQTSDGFDYAVTNGAVTITGYTGTNLDVVIPSTINGMPVTSIVGYLTVSGGGTPSGGVDIAHSGFVSSITSITIPDSVTSIGYGAFGGCSNLTSVTLPNSVTNIWAGAFENCLGLTTVTIPDSVTSIGAYDYESVTVGPFEACFNLASVTLGNSVTLIGDYAFAGTVLTNVTIPSSVTYIGPYAFCCGPPSGSPGVFYFLGDCPQIEYDAFLDFVTQFTFQDGYVLPGTAGWGVPGTTGDGFWPQNGCLRVALWQPQIQTEETGFGVGSNSFGFNVNWASGMTVVVEASPVLNGGTWTPLATNTLTSSSFYFTDPEWKNYPSRFYRVRWQ